MVLKTRIQKDYLFEKHIKANSKRFCYRWIQKNRKYIEWIRFSAIHIAGHHKSLVPGWKKCGETFFFDTKYGQSQCWNKNTHKTGTHSLYCVLNAEAAMLLLLVLRRVAVSFAIQINLIHFCFTIDTLAVLNAIPMGMNNMYGLFYGQLELLPVEFVLFLCPLKSPRWFRKRCRLHL